MKIRCILFYLLFITPALLFPSQKINFLLPLEDKNTGRPVEVPVEWSEDWFGEKTSFEYSHSLARFACYFSDAAYSDVLSSPKDNALFDAYRKIGVNESLIEAHYDIDYKDAMWGNDQCAFSLASKKIKSSKGEQTLVFVIIRGTPLNANEWLSNLNINDANQMQESIHKGFARAANIIHTALISYMLRHKIDPTDSFLFMTGHSRGAAVANLLSSIILDDNFFKSENIYTYTFAAPNVTTDEEASGQKYGFIWNIVNSEDIVPTVPMNFSSWKYHKYGHVLAFSNQTNTEYGTYTEIYIPKINAIYTKIAGREYKPFTTGPFVPIVVTKLVSYLSGDVEKYYGGVVNLHTRAVNLMEKIFPDRNEKEEKIEKEMRESSGGFGSWFVSWLNSRSGGLLDYVSLALADMHSNEVYLSYMLALEESDVFSDSHYSLVSIKGYEEVAVFDLQGNILARVIDGKISYSDMKLPVILCPSLGKTFFMGYPSNLDFEVAVTDEAILPSPVQVTVEFYDATGVFLNSETKSIYPRKKRVYKLQTGQCLLEKDCLEVDRLSRKRGRELIAGAALKPELTFNVIPELYMNTDFNLGFGLHIGSPLIYASVMTAQGLNKFGESGEVTFGIGHQHTIFSQFKMDGELLSKCVWLDGISNKDSFFIVPEVRAALSVKAIGRLHVFGALMMDFEIDGYNNEVFESKKRNSSVHSFETPSSLTFVPNLQLGLRF